MNRRPGPRRSQAARSATVIASALLSLAACGGESTSDRVPVSGRLQATWSAGACGTPGGSLGETLAESFVGARLTFRDGAGNIVGVANTINLQSEPGDGGNCIFFADYRVELKRADFYEVEYNIENWGDSASEEPVSYQELEARNFRWIINLGTF